MTADVPSLLAATSPGLADLRSRVRFTLSPEAQAQVDAHTTQAQHLLEEVFAGLVVWMLHGSTDLWARAADVAELMDVLPNSMPERITSARKRGEILAEDIRRNVMDSDVSSSITGPTSDCLTTSPRGCTMLSLRAIRRLVVTCEGDRGRHFRSGLERALEFADQAERAILELVLADRERPAPSPLADTSAWARGLLNQLAANGAKVLPKQLLAVAVVASAAAPAPLQLAAETPALDFGPEYSMGLVANARTVGLTHKKLRKLLEETGMWDDPHWVRHGDVIMSGNGKQRTETRHGFRDGWYQELMRRRDPLFGSGGGK